MDKNLLLESHQGYLVNIKNYKMSKNQSHLIHIGLFGSLIGLLGFNENLKLCDFIENEKKILKILTVKRQIEYSNFEILNRVISGDYVSDEKTGENANG